MFSLACNLLKMDVYSNDFYNVSLANSLCYCDLWTISTFNKSKIYQNDISNRPPCFIFQKHIKISPSKLCRFFIYQNCIEKVHWTNAKFFSPSKLRWRNCIEINSIFCPSKLSQTKYIKTTSKFCFWKLHLKSETTWKFVDIFFSKYRHNIDIE